MCVCAGALFRVAWLLDEATGGPCWFDEQFNNIKLCVPRGRATGNEAFVDEDDNPLQTTARAKQGICPFVSS